MQAIFPLVIFFLVPASVALLCILAVIGVGLYGLVQVARDVRRGVGRYRRPDRSARSARPVARAVARAPWASAPGSSGSS